MAVYSVFLLLTLVVGAPYWLVRMLTSGRYRAGLAGRLGRVPEGLKAFGREAAQQARPVAWVHAVSVGEVLAATAMVRALEQAGVAVAVSTTTQAGQVLAERRLPGCAVFYMPLDFRVLVKRYLEVLGPRLMVTMESELWPNVIRECKQAGVPLAVVNARVSDRSFPRYMRLRRIWGPLLREVTVFLAQSEETAERLRRMGVECERVRVTGNLKFDVRAGEATEMTRRVEGLVDGSRLIVAGSTLADEEAALLDAWPAVLAAVPGAVLLIAPRHTDRFEEVSGLLAKSGYPFFRCSALPARPGRRQDRTLMGGGAILLLDTIGDLASMYSVAAVAFVGGSVVAKGGHNPLEPAQFGVPVVMGESYENFKEIVGAMRGTGAIRMVSRPELGGALVELLEDREAAEAMGERGRVMFEAQAGATERTVGVLLELMRGGR
jgi:3-deoxy-D-manno-octulosonic-acid transferase